MSKVLPVLSRHPYALCEHVVHSDCVCSGGDVCHCEYLQVGVLASAIWSLWSVLKTKDSAVESSVEGLL